MWFYSLAVIIPAKAIMLDNRMRENYAVFMEQEIFDGESVFSTFEEKTEEIKVMLRKNFKLGMLYIDTAHLRYIEYEHGKDLYEHLLDNLKEIIHELRDNGVIRKEDLIVLNYSEGDVFYVFLSKQRLEGKFHTADFESLAERVRLYISTRLYTRVYPFIRGLLPVHVGYGISFFNPSINEYRIIQTLIADAEQMARSQGVRSRMIYKEEVYDLILDKKVKTLYQPIVDLKSQEVIGYEAFSRGPEGTEFEDAEILFQVARDIGLLYELDWLSKINIFIDAKEMDRGLKLFVNIYSSSIRDSATRLNQLKDLLEDTSIGSHDVIFEIADKHILKNTDFFVDLTNQNQQINFAVVVDDAWLKSSLSTLKNLRVKYIKLNKTLIRDLDQAASHREFVKDVHNLAMGLGARVIAEGIQSKGELQVLLDLGIESGQGYLFAHPGPPFPAIHVMDIFLDDEKLKRRLLASIYFKRGMDLFNRGLFDQAILEFSKSLEVNPGDLETLYYLGYAYLEEGSSIAAVQEADKILFKNPEYVNAWMLKGLAYFFMEDWEKAGRSLVKYLEVVPSHFQSNIELVKSKLAQMEELGV